MFNLDPGKLLVIAVVAIILLGPDRLPQVARQVGAAWRSFNEFRHRMESEVRSSMPDLPPTSEIARLARSPSALLNHLSNMSDGDAQEPATNAEEADDSETAAGSESTVTVVDGRAAPAVAAAGSGEAAAWSASNGAHGTDHDAQDAARAQATGEAASGNGAAAPGVPVAPWPPQTPAAPTPETVVPADPSLN